MFATIGDNAVTQRAGVTEHGAFPKLGFRSSKNEDSNPGHCHEPVAVGGQWRARLCFAQLRWLQAISRRIRRNTSTFDQSQRQFSFIKVQRAHAPVKRRFTGTKSRARSKQSRQLRGQQIPARCFTYYDDFRPVAGRHHAFPSSSVAGFHGCWPAGGRGRIRVRSRFSTV